MPTLEGRITVWDPPAVFEWWWSTDRLRWELDDVDGGTRLRFTTWLGPTKGAANTAAGYHVCLANLATLLDTGTAPPLVDAHTAAGAAVRPGHRPARRSHLGGDVRFVRFEVGPSSHHPVRSVRWGIR